MEKMSRALERAKMLVGMEVDEEVPTEAPSFFDDFNRQCTLTTKQRLYGFAICLAAGLACTFLEVVYTVLNSTSGRGCLGECCRVLADCSFLLICSMCNSIKASLQKYFETSKLIHYSLQSILVFFNPIKFGITFTFGNLLALGSTAFLIGPKRQFDMMLDPVRIYATAIYISSLIIALFCAFYVHSKLLTLLAIMLEFGALVWYGLSYIPFARSMVSKVFYACMDTEF